MSKVTIAQFAEVVGTPADRLLEQLASAGVDKQAITDEISEEEKMKLLGFLRQSHGEGKSSGGKKKVTLKRKSTSTLKVGGGARAAGKSVNVEVRRKRAVVKPVDQAATEEQRKLAEDQLRKERESRDEEDRQRVQQDEERRQHQLKMREEEERTRIEAERRQKEEADRKAREEEEQRILKEQARQVAEKAATKKREEEKTSEDRRGRKKGAKPETRYGRKELHVAGGMANKYHTDENKKKETKKIKKKKK